MRPAFGGLWESQNPFEILKPAINSPFIIHPKTLERGSGLWIGCSQSRQNTWPSGITVDSETCAISGSASSALINLPLVIDAENSSGEKVQATLVMNIANKATYEFVKSSETYLFTGSNFIVKIPMLKKKKWVLAFPKPPESRSQKTS